MLFQNLQKEVEELFEGGIYRQMWVSYVVFRYFDKYLKKKKIFIVGMIDFVMCDLRLKLIN